MRKQTKARVARLLEEAATFYEREAKRFGIPNDAGKMITFAPEVVNGFLARAEECRQVVREMAEASSRPNYAQARLP